VVLELGAGCGLPGIVAGIGLRPDVVYITDIHEPTLKNAECNVQLNEGAFVCEDSNKIVEQHDNTDVIMSDDYSDNRNATNNKTSTTTIHVIRMDWTTIASYPCEKVDLLLGSDLVYDINILSILVPTICYLLHADGSFLYVAPDTGRQGREVVVCAIYHQAIIIIIMTTIIIMISSSCYLKVWNSLNSL
jgi:predicted nicotinamide N-methyase